jgi:hypothetical protein
MPNISDFLSGVFQGATHPKGNMGDFQHAARLYGDNIYALTPKAGWMYYAFFSINPAAETVIGQDPSFYSKNRDLESGMLVKSADLPKFTIQTEQLNQYNRRTVVQTKINYSPVTINFHDDMSNVTNTLWWNYYRYYFRDSTYNNTPATATVNGGSSIQKSPAYGNTKYSANPAVSPNGYGLNNNQGEPFFNSIILYQLNRRFFTSYIFVNPIISAWDHSHLDQSQNNLAENKMTIQYETVFYGQGQVQVDNPPGFATFHYDNSPSPLSIQGGGTSTLLGPGGVIPGALELFGDVNNVLNGNGSPLSLLGAGLTGVNLIKNASKLTGAGIAAEGYSIAGGLLGAIGANGGKNGNISGAISGIGGGAVGAALGIFKGGNSSTNGQTQATTRSIIGGGTGAVDTTGGTTTQSSNTATPLPEATPIDPNSLPSDSASIGSLISDTENNIATLEAAQQQNQTLQESYNNAIAAAKANGGDSAVAQVNASFASAGYQDPAKIQASIDILNSNDQILTDAYNAALQSESGNPSLANDDDVDGPADPNADVNIADNQDGSEEPITVVDNNSSDSANTWSV